jgi:hypothetical protein
MTAPAFSSAASPAPERLIGGDTMPRVTREVVVPTGQTIVPGLVMGRVTATGQWIRSLSAAVDGSQTPRGIAMTTVTTTGNTEVPIFVTGEFAEAQLVLGVGHTLASIREGLADLNIYLRASVAE